MTETEKLREDIAYIRAATKQSEAVHVPSIDLLWAAIALCGFALVDFAPHHRWVSAYWMVAAPAGGLLSMWLGRRASRNIGQPSRDEGFRQGLHWLAFMVAGMLGLALVLADQLTWPGFASLWILLMALTYFQAGVHLERRLLPVGLLIGVAYLITILYPTYGWTTAGVVAAVTLTVKAFLGARTRDATV